MIKTILNPDLYHGKSKKDNFFEGWYFKLVHPYRNYVFCFIPGITLSGKSHSFIQVLDGLSTQFNYISYAVKDFSYASSKFNVKIANNYFSIDGLSVNLINGNKRIKGKLSFRNTKKWPDNLINPGSMGFYNYLTFMQCYSHVCSMDSDIIGSLTIDDKIIDFTSGKAYIEKNWGRDFPYSYVWTQCNNFNVKNISLTCSIAHIPFPISSFTGFLIGLYIKDKFYKFTSTNRSKLKLSFINEKVIITAWNKKHLLKFCVHAPSYSFMNLYAPRDTKMIPIARESLQGKLNFELIDRSTNNILYSSQGYSAGLEFSGDYLELQ